MLPYAWGEPTVAGRLRERAEHFRVVEVLELDASDDGEFNWVYLEKNGLTTPEAADILQRYSGARDVQYSGLKDKQAITRQWFALHMLGAPNADWQAFNHAGLTILESQRHRRKLRRGTHRYNDFELVLAGVELAEIEERLAKIKTEGVPNYFGEQRFGRSGDNLEQARRWLLSGRKTSRFKRGLWLSVIRSHLFNTVLAERVVAGTWNQPLSGELFCLGDGNSLFADDGSDALVGRCAQGEIQPSGPLPGRGGKLMPAERVAELEREALADQGELLSGLERLGVDASRRALRMYPGDFEAQASDAGVRLRFRLPRGCFATALVRELIRYSES